MKITIHRKIILGFGLVLVLMTILTVIVFQSVEAFIRSTETERRLQQALHLTETLFRRVERMEIVEQKSMLAGEKKGFQRWKNAGVEVQRYYSQLREQVTDDETKTLLREFRELMTKRLVLWEAQGEWTLEHGVKIDEVAAGVREILNKISRKQQRLLSQEINNTRNLGIATKWAITLGVLLTFLFLLLAGITIIRDVSARIRAEQALADKSNLLLNLLNCIPDHLFVKDLSGRYILNNDAHRKYFKLSRHEEIAGKTLFDFFPRELALQYQAEDEKIIASGKPLLHRDNLEVDLDGKLVWFSTSKVPLRDTEGKIIGVVCVSTDISETKEAEEKLKIFASQLEKSNYELQNFASVASHDLQEPLRKIQAFGDRLRAKCASQLDETGLDYLERIEHATIRMRTLIHDLLTLSRITSRAQPFDEVDLHRIIKEVLSDMEVLIEQTGAHIEIGNLPVIEADPLQMRQLFQNLLSNALKFQKPGEKPFIMISSRILGMQETQIPGALPGDKICQIRIEDNGIGFDEKYLDRIFNLFQRLHGRNEYEGTGIGLAVCRKIVDRHGGKISAKSAEGEGATFIVTLPLKQQKKESHE